MSEYTPTTDEVRRRFATVDVGQYTPDCVVDAEEEAAFNRWLAEVERAAAEKAYERGRLDERHDCERQTEYDRGDLTREQLAANLRARNPYRASQPNQRQE